MLSLLEISILKNFHETPGLWSFVLILSQRQMIFKPHFIKEPGRKHIGGYVLTLQKHLRRKRADQAGLEQTEATMGKLSSPCSGSATFGFYPRTLSRTPCTGFQL
jgi:hypothetical protein